MSPRTFSLLVVLCAAATAQEPVTPAPATDTKPVTATEPLRRAFVDASADRTTIHSAANHVNKSGAEGRARFMAVLHAIAAVAPKPADNQPAPAPGAPKPIEFEEDVRRLMGDVAIGTPEQCQAALDKLVALPETGKPAIARLSERGNAILQRCILSFVRAKVATNAVYAGQYDDLRDYEPESRDILLGWAKAAPKEAASTATFRSACVRALRDVVSAEEVTDALRGDVRTIIASARQGGDESLFVTAACALHQFGDPSCFDAIKAEIDKQLAGENEDQKLSATSTLADLYYQLRKYEDAATQFAAVVAMLEKAGRPPESMTTVSYNAACSLALAGKTDDAFVYLEKALQYGAQGRQLGKAMLDEDRDISSLRADPRYKKLVDQHFTIGRPVR